jgi:senataxin
MDRFVSVAFSRTFNSLEWATARTSVRILLSQVLEMDCQDISTTIIQLSRALSHRDSEITAPDVRKQSWTKIFASILPHDSNATSTMISIAARFAHLNPLTENAFASVLSKQGSKAKVAFNEVNDALTVFRTGYSEVISKYANYNSPMATEALLRQSGVAKERDNINALSKRRPSRRGAGTSRTSFRCGRARGMFSRHAPELVQ